MSVGIREAYELRKRNGRTATTFVWCGIATGVDNVNHLTEVSFIRGEGGEIWQCKISGLSISYPESSGFLVSGATSGRLWGHQILLPQDFCGKTMETVTEQPIKKIEFFRCPQSLPGVAPLNKKPEDSGYEIAGLSEWYTMPVTNTAFRKMRSPLVID